MPKYASQATTIRQYCDGSDGSDGSDTSPKVQTPKSVGGAPLDINDPLDNVCKSCAVEFGIVGYCIFFCKISLNLCGLRGKFFSF